MSKGRVSVSIVTFQQEAFVGEALRSALEQDMESVEVVVGDEPPATGRSRSCASGQSDTPGE